MQSAQRDNLVRKQVMLSSANIQKLECIAANESQSMSQVLRNAVDSYDPQDQGTEDEKLLAELVAVVNATTAKAEQSLSKGLSDVEQLLAELKHGHD